MLDNSSVVYVTAHNNPQVMDGLRLFMLSVYNQMVAALAISGVSAWLTMIILGPWLSGWFALLLALVPLPFVFVLSYGIYNFQYNTARLLFVLFAISMGMSMSLLFRMFTAESIVVVFFITAATFASASIVGYTTKRDLSGWGNFLIMGVVGILIASIVNIWLMSSMLSFVVSVLAVLLFTALTAWDTQNLKNDYLTNGDVLGYDSPERSALYGALSLYLNFVNIFQALLSLLGDRDD